MSHSVSELFLLSDDMQISMNKNDIANSRGSGDTDVSHSGVGPKRSTHTKKQKYEHLNVLKMPQKNSNSISVTEHSVTVCDNMNLCVF